MSLRPAPAAPADSPVLEDQVDELLQTLYGYEQLGYNMTPRWAACASQKIRQDMSELIRRYEGVQSSVLRVNQAFQMLESRGNGADDFIGEREEYDEAYERLDCALHYARLLRDGF